MVEIISRLVMGRAERMRKRFLLFLWQRGECAICGEPMHLREEDCAEDLQRMATLDHICRVREGGDDSLRNLRAVHKSCNEARD